MDHKKPAGRGYGYVAVSRFKTRLGCHFFGKLRVTDYLPVDPADDDEQLERGYHSCDSDDSEGSGQENIGTSAIDWEVEEVPPADQPADFR